MTPRLYRSRTDAMLGGVCGGIAGYLAVDVALVRFVAVLLVLSNGIGVLPYLLLWIIVPLEPLDTTTATTDLSAAATTRANPSAWIIVGLALMVLGALSLLDHMHIWWFRWFEWDLVWPVVLIIGGAALLWRRSHPVDTGV